MICIKNGRVHDAVHETPYIGNILIEEDKIISIGSDFSVPVDAHIIDAGGMEVYPGFVEAHCHLGLEEYGIGYEGMDINELNDAVTPQMRGIDSINPLDPTFEKAAMAGITCVGTGPGSGNVLGGTFAAIKTVGHCVDDMIVKDGVAMKCAFGENPKNCYKNKSVYTRMTIASKLREALYKTKDYLARKEAADGDISKTPAYDFKLEALIPVIKGEMPLKAHAHRADDILTAIRIAKEFGVGLTLEHCTEGHLIADKLASENYPLAVGPSLTHATKFELRNKSFTTPGILANAGCQVSIITDSPVIPQEYLPMVAGLAVKAGMKPFDALKAITINPAKHLGIEDRVGSLEPGKDADIVIMNGSAFESLTETVHVLINGQLIK